MALEYTADASMTVTRTAMIISVYRSVFDARFLSTLCTILSMIRYASGFDPTSADSIRGINGAVRFLLSTSHSERCYISQYSCGSDLANLGYESTNTIFVRVFLDSGSELTSNMTNIYVKIKLQHNKYIVTVLQRLL